MFSCPDFLSHYYEQSDGPFRNLSDLPIPQAEGLLQSIRQNSQDRFASRRQSDYLSVRQGLEERIRELFIAKGGRPSRARPHYLILGACPRLLAWYPHGCELHILLSVFKPEMVSFTYGDTFPAMRYQDGKPYRGQVYTLAEIPDLVERFGLPQDWNPDGALGPDRYIEAQVWNDTHLEPFFIHTRGD